MPLQTVPEVFSTAGAASEISDCDASEALGFGEASEADALDIDDGISMQDVDATAAVLPPHSLRDVCVMTLLFRLCSRSMFRTTCRCVSRRWSPSAPSSLAPILFAACPRPTYTRVFLSTLLASDHYDSCCQSTTMCTPPFSPSLHAHEPFFCSCVRSSARRGSSASSSS